MELHGYAYFVERPRKIEDLMMPHLVEKERPYRIVTSVQLTAIDYEKFITDIADIGRLLQVVTASAVVVSAILTAVMFLAELTPTEAAVLCFVGAEILPQAAVEMQAVIPLVAAARDEGPALLHLSGYGCGRSAEHPSDDVKRVPENKPFLDHGSLRHT